MNDAQLDPELEAFRNWVLSAYGPLVTAQFDKVVDREVLRLQDISRVDLMVALQESFDLASPEDAAIEAAISGEPFLSD